MAQQVSSKLLILFGLVCSIFFFAESSFAAVANKSSTFSAQLANQEDSDSQDSSFAEQIRAQRAAIDARENRDNIASKTKSGATKNSCDNDLRKCIESKCGDNYKKCETDFDTTFSDKLNSCKKNTGCTAHEFSVFVNEIKEDKKQAIRLAQYNQVLDCGNRYNDCIITECGQKFDKCLGKSAGDKAIAKCKSIATECTEADSGLTARVGTVFGIVRQDAEKQVKADEQKLYSLRDQMRNSCKTLGALFDDRSLDCVFTANFFSGEDHSKPTASKKLYAGSIFDCTPDWFGIDVTTFKENAYRLTRAQSAASSAMMGSGLGTALGAVTSGAIDRAIDSKKAKDALEEACEENGQVLKDGKCVDKEEDEDEDEEEESLTPEQKCTKSGGNYDNNQCTCPEEKNLKLDGDRCVDMKAKDKCTKAGGALNVLGKCKCKDKTKKYENEQCVDDPEAIAKKDCKDSGGKWKNNTCKCDEKTQNLVGNKCVDDEKKKAEQAKKTQNEEADKKCTKTGGTYNATTQKCECDASKGLMPSKTPGTCNCKTPDLRKGPSQLPALNKNGVCSYLYSDDATIKKQRCAKYGSSKLTDTGCSCPSSEHYVHAPISGYTVEGYYSPYKCDCANGYEMKDYKCVPKSNSQTHSNSTSVTKQNKMQRREQDSQDEANREAANKMVQDAMNNLLHKNNEFQ